MLAPDLVAPEVELSKYVSELPNTFDDAIVRIAKRTIECIKTTGNMKIRIDFDTSVGDVTYTSIKNTIPMMKALANVLSREMGLSYKFSKAYANPIDFEPIQKGTVTATSDTTNTATESTDVKVPMQEESNEGTKLEEIRALQSFEESLPPTIGSDGATLGPDKTMRIFFPDMGEAALARRDWKMGSALSEVPSSIFTANIQNDVLSPSDAIAIILCPQSTEVDSVKRVVDMCESKSIPCIIINPSLVNMDQGYGVRARNLRKDLISKFTTVYKLKTMKYGAIVREWPSGYSVWNDDATNVDGYRILQTYAADPSRELIDDLYDAANPDVDTPKKNKNDSNIITEMVGFFKGLSRM